MNCLEGLEHDTHTQDDEHAAVAGGILDTLGRRARAARAHMMST
jgi:hypothetical protein